MTTLILGASTNPARYSYKAAKRLTAAGEKIVMIGAKKSVLDGEPIMVGEPALSEIDTVTLYVGAARQPQYYDYLVKDLKPRRIIFNPGTENPELEALAQQAGIKVQRACTLVMLATGQY